MLSGTPQSFVLSYLGPETRNGLCLTRNGFRFHGLHSGVKRSWPAPSSPALLFPGPFGLSLHRRKTVRPVLQPLLRLDPLPVPCRARPAVAPVSTPPRDSYLPTDQSVLPDESPAGPPSEFARSPFAPRFRFYF